MIDINLMGPIHVIEAFVPPMVAARPRRPPGQRVLGGRAGRAAVARRLQREQVRAARTVRGAAVRPGAPPHRGVRRGARCGENPTGADGSDRRRGPRGSEREQVGRPVRRPCGLAGDMSPTEILRGVVKQPVPDLHLTGHPRAVHVQARDVVALQRGDAPGQRGVHPGAAPGEADRASVYPIPTAAS